MKGPRINVVVPVIDRDGLTDYWIKIDEHLKKIADTHIIDHKKPYSKNPFYFIKLALQAKKADIVHVQHVYCLFGVLFDKFNNVFAFLFYFFLKFPLGPKVITTIHDVVEDTNINFIQRLYLNMMNFPMRVFSDKVIVHKHTMRRQLLSQGFSDEQIVKLPFGVDVLKKVLTQKEARKKFKIPEKKTIVLFGWIRHDKQPELVIDALPLLPDMQVLVIGGVTPHEKKFYASFKEHVKKSGVADRVKFIGRIPSKEKYNWLCCADVLVLPYSRISSSGALSDSITVNVPLVTSQLSEFKEVEKEWGVLTTTNVYDKKVLAKAIKAVIKTKPRFTKMRNTYIKANSREKVAQLTEKLYASVIKN